MINGFQHFTEWAKGRTFNEILGCAKGHLCGLTIHYDVDEYNNKIACAIYYYPNEDWKSKPTYIEIELLPNGTLLFTDLNEQKEHEKAVEGMKADIYRLLGFKQVSANDCELLSYWNDYVNEYGQDYDYKLYDMDEENLDTILEDYSTNSIARFILNIDNRFSTTDKFFYITNDYRICTTNNIWDVVNEVELYEYIVRNVRMEKYGKVWDRSLYHEKENEEILVCKMENGDEIWSNAEKSYFALYPADTDKPAYLHIYG